MAVALVPPLEIGKAVPDKDSANVPAVVIGLPDTDKKEGTVMSTEVTLPVPDTVAQVGAPDPFDLRT